MRRNRRGRLARLSPPSSRVNLICQQLVVVSDSSQVQAESSVAKRISHSHGVTLPSMLKSNMRFVNLGKLRSTLMSRHSTSVEAGSEQSSSAALSQGERA